MAFAKKCDICGMFYDEYGVKRDSKNPNGFMPVNIDHKGDYYNNPCVDCCPKCMATIMETIETLKRRET